MAVGTVYRIAVKQAGSLVAEAPYSWNVRHYVCADEGAGDSPADLIEAFRAQVETAISSCLPGAARICRYQAGLALTPTVIDADQIVDVPGTAVPQYWMPTFLAILIRLQWSADPLMQRWDGKWLQGFIPHPVGAGQGLDNWNRAIFLSDQLDVQATSPITGAVYAPVVWHKAAADSSPVIGAAPQTRYYVVRARGKHPGDIWMDVRSDIA